jgi:hypothetical protein
MKSILYAVIFSLIGMSTPAYAADHNKQFNIIELKLKKMLNSGVLPIIDIEFHYGSKISIDDLKERMDENGVAITWLGPNEKLGSEASLPLSRAYPDYFVPTTVHGDGKLWHSGDKGFLEKLAQDVKSGNYLAMGEFEARHYVSSTNNRDIHTPVDSEAMQAVFAISSETGVPFLLHHEAEDVLLPELERMLVKYPKAIVVWCHVGRNRNPETWIKFRSVEVVREYLQKYPNLYFDFTASRPGSIFPPTGYIDAIMYKSSTQGTVLVPEWKELFEEFPDRFLIGSDINTGRFSKYDEKMFIFRKVVLGNLRKDVAERIAFKNAWKLMTRQEWKN